MRRILIAAVAVIAAGSVIAGKGATAATNSGANPLTVTTTAYPLFEAATAIGGNRVKVTNLRPTGAFSDTPLTAKESGLLDADLDITLGKGTQPLIDGAMTNRTGSILSVLNGIATLPAQADQPGTADPYAWMDPILFAKMSSDIQKRLTALDPNGEQYYLARASGFRANLAKIDRQYAHVLAGCSRTVLLTEQPAFAYLAARYGLDQEPVTDTSPAAIKTLSQVTGATTLFAPGLMPSRQAHKLFSETGVRVAVLDPLANRTDQARRGGANYTHIFDLNLNAMEAAFGCTQTSGGL